MVCNLYMKKKYYKLHQELLEKVKLALQKKFPSALILDRHVGLFITTRGTPVKINKKGMADLWMLYNGIHVEIEIKTGKARQTKEQLQWQKTIESKGSLYLLARSVDDVESLDI